MKTQRTDRIRTVRWLSTALLFAAILAMVFPAGAWALGTASGTSINNQATISYNVGTIPQSPIASDGDGNFGNGPEFTTFVVDNLVDLNVSTLGIATGPVAVTPGAVQQVIAFQVDNEGNTVQDFILSAIGQANGSGPYALPYGAPDNSLNDDFDSSSPVRLFVDDLGQAPTTGYTPGTWGGVGTETEVGYIDELAADNSITVYIVIDVALTQTDGQVAIYGMQAQVAQGGGAGQGAAIANDDSSSADTAGVDIVFGDAVGVDDPDQTDPDGYHSSRGAYRVGSAALTVAKVSVVQWDPVNLGANPKAIPHARVRYTITITNGGSVDADNIVLTDAIPANTWFYVGSVTGGAAAYSNDGGGTYTYGPSGGAYGEDQAVTNVQATVGTVAAGANVDVTFEVIIQ